MLGHGVDGRVVLVDATEHHVRWCQLTKIPGESSVLLVVVERLVAEEHYFPSKQCLANVIDGCL